MSESAAAQAPSRHLLATLRARYDGAALQVALPGRQDQATHEPTAAQIALWAPLRTWCFQGAGDGASPLMKPAQAPRVERRLSVAEWPTAVDDRALELIETFSRHLDGSHQLQRAGGVWSRWLLRLRVKACDVAWWRPRRFTDPWDCGYVLNEPAARVALARFEPRRATLLVSVAWPTDALIEAMVAMARSSTQFAHPVRWLVVKGISEGEGDEAVIAERLRSAGVPVQRLQPRAAET